MSGSMASGKALHGGLLRPAARGRAAQHLVAGGGVDAPVRRRQDRQSVGVGGAQPGGSAGVSLTHSTDKRSFVMGDGHGQIGGGTGL